MEFVVQKPRISAQARFLNKEYALFSNITGEKILLGNLPKMRMIGDTTNRKLLDRPMELFHLADWWQNQINRRREYRCFVEHVSMTDI